MEDEFTNEEFLLYFGTLEKERNISEVAEDLFGEERKSSVRSSISGKDADEKLMEKGLLQPKKEGRWKYKANENKLSSVLIPLLKYEDEQSELPAFSKIEDEEEVLQEMFVGENMRNFFKSKYLNEILTSKVSDTREQLSFYFKMLTLMLGSTRKLLRESDKTPKAITINREKIEMIEDFLSFAFSVYEDELRDLKKVYQILKEVAPTLNLKEFRPFDNQKMINKQYEMLDKVIENMGGDSDNNSDFFVPTNSNVNESYEGLA